MDSSLLKYVRDFDQEGITLTPKSKRARMADIFDGCGLGHGLSSGKIEECL